MSPYVPVFVAVYGVCALILAAFEIYAIADRRRGETISETFWRLRTSPLVWAVVPLVTWTFFHFVMPFEPDNRLWNDLLYVLIGLVLAVWNVRYQARRRNP